MPPRRKATTTAAKASTTRVVTTRRASKKVVDSGDASTRAATTTKRAASKKGAKTTTSRGKNANAVAAKLTKISAFPAEFECTSGELLWGQVNTVLQGAASDSVDTTTGPKERLTGGTILQHNFSYRVAAKQGRWVVDEVAVGNCPAFVCYHEDADARDLVRRAANVGISNMQTHEDKRVVYVNRYDWVERDFGELIGGRCLLMDADSCDLFVSALKRKSTRLEQRTYALTNASTSSTFGVHLSNDDIEYELGWMIFDDDSEELVGFVYDCSYSALSVENCGEITVAGVPI
ncbi:TPA: hypothetical protein N0F65_005041 [Lagenidium giganteum]|uniref:Uncharacterized protein n=1 Tax=Lagenidium giganteum TaxID=4803 RepID=A0AAV2ZH37_9STRA|nr:TPA: hypothetical protein N0F65_005041 [Lagenidium giganteum]